MGRESQAYGAVAEELVDISLRRYHADGLVAWAPTYPEVRFVSKGQARATGEALPDRCVAIRSLGGRLLWLEIKTWQAKNRHTLRQRLHQLAQMRDFAQFGGAMGAYLVAWRWDGTIDWRLYPALSLAAQNGAVVFCREDGLPVDDENGFPDWLPAVMTR